jgi:hypothetical protein
VKKKKLFPLPGLEMRTVGGAARNQSLHRQPDPKCELSEVQPVTSRYIDSPIQAPMTLPPQTKKHSMAFIPQANYTNRVIAAAGNVGADICGCCVISATHSHGH